MIGTSHSINCGIAFTMFRDPRLLGLLLTKIGETPRNIIVPKNSRTSMRRVAYQFISQAKIALAFLLYYSGALFLLKRIKLRNKAAVLMFHRVLPKADRSQTFSTDAILVEPDNFRRRLSFLQRHFSILNASAFERHFNEDIPFQDSSCLITFDDAWQDNFHYAFPILQEFCVPALIFVPIHYIETEKLFWQEVMGHGFLQILNVGSPNGLHFIDDHHLSQCVQMTRLDQMRHIAERVRHYKSLPYDKIDEIIEQQKAILGRDIERSQVDHYLTWAQVNMMKNSGIDFGSHACSHRFLTRLPHEEVERELVQSKRAIFSVLGTDPRTIAYPNGDYNSTVGKIAARTGYRIGFGTEYGLVTHNDDQFSLNRINMSDKTASSNAVLLATILGVI